MRPGADPLRVAQQHVRCRPACSRSSSSSESRAVEQRGRQRLHALDRDALGQLVEHLGQLRVLLAPARAARSRTSAVSSSSRHGGAHSRSTFVDGALVGDGEGADLLDLVAPELHPRRVLVGRREDVEDAAAHGELAALGDQVDPGVRDVGQPADDLVQVGRRRRCAARTGSRSPRPLSWGCSTRPHRRDDHPQRAALAGMGQPAQHGQPPPDRVASGARAARAAASPRPGRPRPGRPASRSASAAARSSASRLVAVTASTGRPAPPRSARRRPPRRRTGAAPPAR